jgi:hypothetical protein
MPFGRIKPTCPAILFCLALNYGAVASPTVYGLIAGSELATYDLAQPFNPEFDFGLTLTSELPLLDAGVGFNPGIASIAVTAADQAGSGGGPNPVPEPAGLAVLAVSLVMLSAMRRPGQRLRHGQLAYSHLCPSASSGGS